MRPERAVDEEVTTGAEGAEVPRTIDGVQLAPVPDDVRPRLRVGDAQDLDEVGLAGEIRSTTQSALRLREAAQMGFTRCILPAGQASLEETGPGCELIGVRTVGEALDALFE